jgi:hypothetical protein
VLDLMPAARAGSDDRRVRRLLSDAADERSATFSDSSYSESSAPNAPAMPQQLLFMSVADRPGRRCASLAMKLVAVSDFAWQCARIAMFLVHAVSEPQRLRFTTQEIVDELLKQEAAFRHGVEVRHLQLAIILDEHRVAGRLEKQDRRAIVRPAQ